MTQQQCIRSIQSGFPLSILLSCVGRRHIGRPLVPLQHSARTSIRRLGGVLNLITPIRWSIPMFILGIWGQEQAINLTGNGNPCRILCGDTRSALCAASGATGATLSYDRKGVPLVRGTQVATPVRMARPYESAPCFCWWLVVPLLPGSPEVGGAGLSLRCPIGNYRDA